jgi:hypothetical protein
MVSEFNGVIQQSNISIATLLPSRPANAKIAPRGRQRED